jgi:hypothetical protein
MQLSVSRAARQTGSQSDRAIRRCVDPFPAAQELHQGALLVFELVKTQAFCGRAEGPWDPTLLQELLGGGVARQLAELLDAFITLQVGRGLPRIA